MADTALDDTELWDEFHRVVNMSSRELAERHRLMPLGHDPLKPA